MTSPSTRPASHPDGHRSRRSKVTIRQAAAAAGVSWAPAAPVGQIAERAGQMLLDLIDGKDVDPDLLMFPPWLVLRQSA